MIFHLFTFQGYNNGRIILVDVENHQILHTLELKGDIVSLNWTQNTKESYDDFDDLQGNTKLVRACFNDGKTNSETNL